MATGSHARRLQTQMKFVAVLDGKCTIIAPHPRRPEFADLLEAE